MKSFSDLSVELVLDILGSLETKDLASLSCAAKNLRPIVEPLLYREIDWFWMENEAEEVNPPIKKFVRTILERPQLAAYIKRIRFECEFNPFYSVELHVKLAPSDIDRMLMAIHEGEFSFAKALIGGIKHGYLDAVIAVLLSRLHNLETLELDYSLARNFDSIGEVLKLGTYSSYTGKSSRFSKLKAICYMGNADISFYRENAWSDRMIFTFGLSSLQSIDMVLPEPKALDWPEEFLSLPNLTILRLRHSEASVATLARILQATPKLHTLQYNFLQDLDEFWEDELQDRGHYDEWRKLNAALQQVSKTLTDLTISADYHYLDDYKSENADPNWVMGIWERRGSLGSLKGLASLKRLEVPLPVLLGWVPANAERLRTVLPENLTELCLRDDLYDHTGYLWTPWDSFVVGSEVDASFHDTCNPTLVLDELQDYFEGIRDHTSRVNSIVLKQQKNRLWDERFMDQFENICRSANVSSKIHLRMGNNDYNEEEDLIDYVEEITLYDPTRPNAKRCFGSFQEMPQLLHDHC